MSDYKITNPKAIADQRSYLLNAVQLIYEEILVLDPLESKNMCLIKQKRVDNYVNQWFLLENKIFEYNACHASKSVIKILDDVKISFDQVVDDINLLLLNIHDNNTSEASIEDKKGVVADTQPAQPLFKTFLKPIEVPKFDGNNFEYFMGIFDQLIHNNNSFSNVIKYHYLLNNLPDESKAIISNCLPISEGTYVLAKNALAEHYINPRKLASKHFNELINYDHITNSHKPDELVKLFNSFKTTVVSLKNVKLQNLEDFMLFQLLYNKLDKRLRIEFEKRNNDSKNIPSYDDLISFLRSEMQAADLHGIAIAPKREELKPKSETAKPKVNHSYKPLVKSALVANSHKSATISCTFCTQTHYLNQCDSFKALSIGNKYSFIKDNKLCIKCLRRHANPCNSKFSCRTCNNPDHNTLLCQGVKPEVPNPMVSTKADVDATPTPNQSCHMCNAGHSQTLLSTAIISVKGGNNNLFYNLRCIIDPGSHVNFISERAALLLKCRRTHDNTMVNGIGGTSSNKGRAELNFKSNTNSFQGKFEALIMTKICNNLPPCRVNQGAISKASNLPLADHSWGVSSAIDVLLGAGVYAKILSNELPIVTISENPVLVAQYSLLGYLIVGITESDTSCTSLLCIDTELHEDVKRLWELDQFPNDRALSSEDEMAESIFQASTTRDAQGRYVVKLPFRPNPIDLAVNKYPPMQSFLKNEAKLAKDAQVNQLYTEFFKDYLKEGIMVQATNSVKYILAHHGVLKDSTSTMVRPVFNASAKDTNGRSLNDLLLNGPSLHSDIFDVLLSFRFNLIPLVCDIKRMYNSVLVNPNDWKHQHILWRQSQDDDVKEFALTRVTFGIGPSGFLAQRVIKQLITDEGDGYPLASQVLNNQIYVDDIVCSFKDTNVAIKAKNELTNLLQRGGFQLRKFASSNSAVLAGTPVEHCDVTFGGEKDFVKVLGLAWSPKEDSFLYSIKDFQEATTKRGILSYAARIYDVKGLLTPVTIAIKCFIKRLWDSNLNWDEELPLELSQEWHAFVNTMPILQVLRIPRYVPVFESSIVEIIGFCDGSSIAHAACIYLRCVNSNGVKMYLIKAKGRVNPKKPQLTIPRTELQAAKLLADLYKSLCPRLEGVNITNVTFCTDSTIVLSWLKIDPFKLQVFVGNRVSHILSITNVSQWKHVRSASNCADPGSRGISPNLLRNCTLWWNGPTFLLEEPVIWPISDACVSDVPEIKTSLLAVVPEETLEITKNFSSINRMQRTYAYVFRFINNLKAKRKGDSLQLGPLTVDELGSSMNSIIKTVQMQYYPEIFSNNCIPKYLQGLTPYIETTTGTIRVGGRLNNAPLPYNSRHPLLIPSKSHLAALLIRRAHHVTLHGGKNDMRSFLQGEHWIVGVNRLLRDCIYKCVKCLRFKVKPPEPQMADLPITRFTQIKPFFNCATDFCGPFLVHEGSRPRAKLIKLYVCIFSCMSTRAAHLEVVQDLSTDAFLVAVDRLVSRRGSVSLMYCDNGTNYRGASRIMKEIKEFLTTKGSEIETQLASKVIKFQFIAPLSPWKNGISERLVGLFKSHLTRVMGNTTLTYVEFETLTIRIEAILNSRPLLPLTMDPKETFLTPSHFLIGSNLISIPEVDLTDVRSSHLSRWQVVRSAVQSFWKQWRNEYLHTLIHRSKWTKVSINVSVGTVVLLKNEATPPLSWPLGVVDEVYPQRDNQVRVAKIRTTMGAFLRPINKLVILNVD